MTQYQVPIHELEQNTPAEVRACFAKIAKGSVLIAVDRPDGRPGKVVHFEGGIYRPNAHQPSTREEIKGYAIQAALRAMQNYPTIAKVFLEPEQAEWLVEIGSIDLKTGRLHLFNESYAGWELEDA